MNLKPSPSPDFQPASARSPSPECAGTLSRNKGPRRRLKTQASQGDAVLINFLAGQNFPDIANRAGEEPLNSASQSEAGDPSSPMDVVDGGAVEEKSFNLVQTAQDALPLVDSNEKSIDEKCHSPILDNTRRSLSKLHTRDLIPLTGNNVIPDTARPKIEEHSSDGQKASNPEGPEPPLSNTHSARAASPNRSPPIQNRPSQVRRGSSTTSALRKYAISPSGRSPMEQLPAMQTSESSLIAQSPSGQQTLPPIHSQFPNLAEDRLTNDKNSRSSVINNNRQHFPLLDGSLKSPTLGSLSTRPGQYPNPQARLNGHFPPPYPPSQPSPASTYSETSPRETFRPKSDSTSMSPRARFGPKQYYPNERTPKSGELTPISAESYQSSGNYGADTSPRGEQISVEGGRPILPPLGSSAPLMAGSFQCEHAGCTALPFQTQYLLK